MANWLTVAEAWQQLEQAAPAATPETESIPVQLANLRTLAAAPSSLINVPPADNSAMDGFAVRLSELEVGASLPVSQRIPAGAATTPLELGTAARIFTGSEVPDGADTVIMQENANYDERQVSFSKLPELSANIRRTGNDILQGEQLLPAGHRIRSQDIGLLAAAGIANVEVFKPLRIGLVTTGDELIKPGKPLSAGKIYESNAPMIAALLSDLGADVSSFHSPDDLDTTIATFIEAAADNDLVISIGGVSVGEEDHVKTALNNLGKTGFWKIGLKPGKPFLMGDINQTPLLGLPGNPVSAYITCCLFCKPFIRKMQGGLFETPKHWDVRADFNLTKANARQQYLRGTLDKEGESTSASLLKKQSSAVMTSLCKADVLVVIPPEATVAAGDMVKVISLQELTS